VKLVRFLATRKIPNGASKFKLVVNPQYLISLEVNEDGLTELTLVTDTYLLEEPLEEAQRRIQEASAQEDATLGSQLLEDFDNILRIPAEVGFSVGADYVTEMREFAKKTVGRLELLADLFVECAEADEAEGGHVEISGEVEKAIEDHKEWKAGRGP
jgi:hypothetical protein